MVFAGPALSGEHLTAYLSCSFIIYSGVEEADELSEEEIALASESNKSNKIDSDEEE